MTEGARDWKDERLFSSHSAVYFAVTSDTSGWWIEYPGRDGGLKTEGPFVSKGEAIAVGLRRGWSLILQETRR